MRFPENLSGMIGGGGLGGKEKQQQNKQKPPTTIKIPLGKILSSGALRLIHSPSCPPLPRYTNFKKRKIDLGQ